MQRVLPVTKKITLLFAAFVFFRISSAYAEPITLAYVDFPPYEFEANGQAEGILVEIVGKIFQRANISLELEFLPFKRAYAYTLRGEIDGLFNFYKTPKRLAGFDYSDVILKNPLVLFVKKGSKITFNTLTDLKGLRIGVMRGYTYGPEFDESTAFIKEIGDSHESNFKKLAVGRLDVYVCDNLVGMHVVRKLRLMSEFDILPVPLIIMDGHIGFTKNKHQPTIRKINEIIKAMRQSGEIDQVISNYKH